MKKIEVEEVGPEEFGSRVMERFSFPVEPHIEDYEPYVEIGKQVVSDEGLTPEEAKEELETFVEKVGVTSMLGGTDGTFEMGDTKVFESANPDQSASANETERAEAAELANEDFGEALFVRVTPQDVLRTVRRQLSSLGMSLDALEQALKEEEDARQKATDEETYVLTEDSVAGV